MLLKSGGTSHRLSLSRPFRVYEVWPMDFVFDRTAEGRLFRCPVIVKYSTHEPVSNEVARAMSGLGVSPVLDRLCSDADSLQ